MSSGDPSLCGDVFFLDEFAMRQWDDPKYGGTRIDFDKAEFVRRVHEAHAAGAPLVDGYAPFCKHVFVPNFVPGTKVGAIPITPENEHLLRSGYSARSDAELAVLTRWFPADKVDIPDATYLDVILYSREQLVKERSAMAAKEERPPLPDAPWGIISVKGQLEDFECPMTPITMMRNTMIEEGGSARRHRSSRVREIGRVSLQTRAHRRRRFAERRVSASIVVRGLECRLPSRRIAGVTSSRARDGSDGTRHV